MSSRTNAADDYAFIRARMEELKPLPKPSEHTEDGAWNQMAYMVSINPNHRMQPGWSVAWRDISSRVGCKHKSPNDGTTYCGYDVSGICANNKKCLEA